MAMIAPGEGTKERNPVEYQFPTGIYKMKLDSVTEIGPSAAFPNGNNRLVFEFSVVEGQYLGKKACAFVGKSLFKNKAKESKLVTFARNMGVVNPENGFDPDALVGKVYTCTCESQPSTTGDGSSRTWVRFVTPANGQQQGVPGVSQPPPASAPPPRSATTGKRYWIDLGTGAESKMVTEAELQRRFTDDVMDWDNVHVCADGEQQWRPIFDAIPAAREWAQRTPF